VVVLSLAVQVFGVLFNGSSEVDKKSDKGSSRGEAIVQK
jgi:alpha-1,3-mannosyltransferase